MCCTDFAAILFNLVFKRRSEEINGEEANDDAAANDETTRGSSSTRTSIEGHEMATPSGYDYEVFLNFRGPDTRAGFTDFLYTSMIDMGIRAYKDDEDLRKGEEFGPTLLQAIEQSRISIPILSKDYASSVWCLKELVKMVECRKTKGQKIMPIFYDVAPAEVRYQTGGYKEAFNSHKKKNRHDEGTMREWKAALEEVSSLDGWNLHNIHNRREGEFTRKFTHEVFNELKKAYLMVSDCLVSVDHQVKKIMEMIGAQTSETRIIGICGMGGIGKTTIAKIIYNQLSHDFVNRCFLSNVRETSKLKGIEWLQNQLISDICKVKRIDLRNFDEGIQTIKDRLPNKRVLLLLDDVEEKDHMDALVGKHDWFGKGSKLIITTRNKDVLNVPEVDDCYEVDIMDPDQSLQLFSKHAFRRDSPLDDHVNQSKRAIGIAGGLPLALEVIGSLLSRIDKKKWDGKLNELENVPPKDVQRKLEISYNELDHQEKPMFLDIACFLIGYEKDNVIHFRDESNSFPERAMEVLLNMSLIKIKDDNEVWMHDQLRDLGRQIVRQESNMKIKEQSRVWDYKEGLHLLRQHKGQKEVEALRLKFDHKRQYHFTYEDFKSLSNLRFLEVDESKGNFSAEETLLWHWHELPSNVFQENLDLLPQLRWLSWHNISPMFKITNFSMEDLVILDLSKSRIRHDWKGWSYVKMAKNLKVLNLSHCQRLKRTPIFSAHSKLERLILYGCESLTEIDRSIGKLKRLVFLELGYCENLQRLPTELGDLERLEYLSLMHCYSLKSLPETIGNLESVIRLDLYCTRIKELPDSIEKLKNLKAFRMLNATISKIPDAFWTIEKLEDISSLCLSARVKIGDSIHRNQSLRNLHLKGVILAVPRLPESLIYLELSNLNMDAFPDLSNLTNLRELELGFGRVCTDGPLEDPVPVVNPLPRWLGNLTKLTSLHLRFYCRTASTIDDPSLPPQLQFLRLSGSDLSRLPRLPSSLSSLELDCCFSLSSTEDLSNLNELSSFHIWGAAITEIQGLGCLENLQSLWLICLRQVKILPDLSNLNKLTRLDVKSCDNLVEIQGELPEYLNSLSIDSCGSLEKLPDLLGLKELQSIYVINCTKLIVEAIFGFARRSQADLWENLRYLFIAQIEQVEILPDLSYLSKLRSLCVYSCRNLAEIQGELPLSLETLKISYCKSLQKLPDLSSLKNLEQVYIRRCTTLKGKAILGSAQRSQANLWENLLYLGICGLGQVKVLPDLSALNKLRRLRVSNCGNLVEIQSELPQSLKNLEISSCESLQKLPDLSSLEAEKMEISSSGSLEDLNDLSYLFGPQIVVIVGCQKLNAEAILGSARKSQANLLENLEYLQICGFGQVKALPDLRNLNKLRSLQVEKCPSLVEIQGELPQSFKELEISSCESLQRLPDLSSLKGLQKVVMKGCMQLNVEAIYRLCLERSVEFVGEDDELEGED